MDEVVDSVNQSGAPASSVSDESPQVDNPYTNHAPRSEGINCPPYSQMVLNNPVSPINIDTSESELINTSLKDEESDS